MPTGDIAQTLGIDSIAGRTIVASVTGGTASALTGGSFANGAQTAAYVHLFNNKAKRVWKYSQSTGELLDPDGEQVGKKVYSVAGKGKNNPDMQDVPNVGPIPLES